MAAAVGAGAALDQPRATYYRHDKAVEGRSLAIENDWQCADPPDCRALVIRLPDGRGTVEVLLPNPCCCFTPTARGGRG